MFYKASGGGIIVGAFCVLKMLYGYIPGVTSPTRFYIQ
jgi:site-specific recombinase